MSERPGSFAEFWRFYLGEHGRPGTRALHLFGTAAGLGLTIVALVAADWRLLVIGVVVGYGLAWIGHAAIERNRPATLTHPMWSLASDLRMLGLFVTGRLGAELKRHNLD